MLVKKVAVLCFYKQGNLLLFFLRCARFQLLHSSTHQLIFPPPPYKNKIRPNYKSRRTKNKCNFSKIVRKTVTSKNYPYSLDGVNSAFEIQRMNDAMRFTSNFCLIKSDVTFA